MICMECGLKVKQGIITDTIEINHCFIIVKNVPCYKCMECNAVFYTGDVTKKLEKMVSNAKGMKQEICVFNYGTDRE